MSVSNELTNYFNIRYTSGIDDWARDDEMAINHACAVHMKRLHEQGKLKDLNLYGDIGSGYCYSFSINDKERMTVTLTNLVIHEPGNVVAWGIHNGRYTENHSMKLALMNHKLFGGCVPDIFTNALLRILKSM